MAEPGLFKTRLPVQLGLHPRIQAQARPPHSHTSQRLADESSSATFVSGNALADGSAALPGDLRAMAERDLSAWMP